MIPCWLQRWKRWWAFLIPILMLGVSTLGECGCCGCATSCPSSEVLAECPTNYTAVVWLNNTGSCGTQQGTYSLAYNASNHRWEGTNENGRSAILWCTVYGDGCGYWQFSMSNSPLSSGTRSFKKVVALGSSCPATGVYPFNQQSGCSGDAALWTCTIS
jgi:hypothetical protein